MSGWVDRGGRPLDVCAAGVDRGHSLLPAPAHADGDAGSDLAGPMNGSGLQGMWDRLAALGGSLTAGSARLRRHGRQRPAVRACHPQPRRDRLIGAGCLSACGRPGTGGHRRPTGPLASAARRAARAIKGSRIHREITSPRRVAHSPAAVRARAYPVMMTAPAHCGGECVECSEAGWLLVGPLPSCGRVDRIPAPAGEPCGLVAGRRWEGTRRARDHRQLGLRRGSVWPVRSVDGGQRSGSRQARLKPS